jgi:hypothetical protein
MNAADQQIAEILAAHGEDFQANTWVVAGGRTRAILHHCTERMAAKEGIKFDQPTIISAQPDNVVILVTGRNQLGAEAWSFGEAAPKNNKNAYPYSMAEKRAKDRVALKLLKLHGLVYSETEADEFRENAESPAPPRRNAGLASSAQVDAFGLPSMESLAPTRPPLTYKQLEKQFSEAKDAQALKQLAIDFKVDCEALSPVEQESLRKVYKFTAKAFEVFA